jgi:hypothetical protein
MVMIKWKLRRMGRELRAGGTAEDNRRKRWYTNGEDSPIADTDTGRYWVSLFDGVNDGAESWKKETCKQEEAYSHKRSGRLEEEKVALYCATARLVWCNKHLSHMASLDKSTSR